MIKKSNQEMHQVATIKTYSSDSMSEIVEFLEKNHGRETAIEIFKNPDSTGNFKFSYRSEENEDHTVITEYEISLDLGMRGFPSKIYMTIKKLVTTRKN